MNGLRLVREGSEKEFKEKVKFYSYDYLKCCYYLIDTEPAPDTYTKRLYSKLISSSHLLEDLLDFHGAKNNQDWYFYRELSATVRHLARAAYSNIHISTRMPSYGLGDTPEFDEKNREVQAFLIQVLRNLAPVILEEAKRLEIPFPEKRFRPYHFPRVSTSFLLEPDIDDAEPSQKLDAVVRIATDFIKIVNSFEEVAFYDPKGEEEIFRMVPGRLNEVQVRGWEMEVHNLQSEFDSYVIHGGGGQGHRKLKMLRGFFSVVLHLLEGMGRMLHFYERHLHGDDLKDTYDQARERLVELVDPAALLDATVNYGLFYICEFLMRGQGLAQVILSENVERDSITVGVPEKKGFHSRPSLMVAKVVQHYGGEVELVLGEDRFDAGSVLDLQWAGGKIKKEDIHEVVFTGNRRALRDIAILASVNYGEDSMGKGISLPKELGYLR